MINKTSKSEPIIISLNSTQSPFDNLISPFGPKNQVVVATYSVNAIFKEGSFIIFKGSVNCQFTIENFHVSPVVYKKYDNLLMPHWISALASTFKPKFLILNPAWMTSNPLKGVFKPKSKPCTVWVAIPFKVISSSLDCVEYLVS